MILTLNTDYFTT